MCCQFLEVQRRSLYLLFLAALLTATGCDCSKRRSTSMGEAASETSDVAIVATPTPNAAAVVEAVDQLANSIQQRLELMPDVARFKWNNKRPVSDPEREEQLLNALTKRATEHGISAGLSRRFFAAQMAAARQMQERLIADWKDKNTEPFENVPDLANDLRPRIDKVSEAMLDSLATLEPALTDAATSEFVANALQQRLNATPQFEADLKTAFEPLLSR